MIELQTREQTVVDRVRCELMLGDLPAPSGVAEAMVIARLAFRAGEKSDTDGAECDYQRSILDGLPTVEDPLTKKPVAHSIYKRFFDNVMQNPTQQKQVSLAFHAGLLAGGHSG